MILTEKEVNQYKIKKLIGVPNKFELNNPKIVGSSSYFLKSFINKAENKEELKIDSKSNFEKYSKGLLLRTNISNKLSIIPIPKNEINSIELIRGNEKVKPYPLSPMWLLMKFGVSKLIARYFKLNTSEYSIEYMKIKIDTEKYKMELIANGYLFENQLAFFSDLNYENKLKTKMPVANIG